MLLRACVLMMAFSQLTGCIAVPEFYPEEKLTFDIPPPDQKPLSYDDLLCCYRCEA